MRTSIFAVYGVPQLALLLVVAAPLIGQNPAIPAGSGRIQGTVFDENGRPLAKTLVVANNRTVLPFSQTAQSGPLGAFDLQGLPAGTYELCVTVVSAKHLDPCQWSTPGTGAVILAAGQTSSGNRLQVKTASKLQIRIQDPDQHLSPRSATTEPPQIVMGVLTPAGITAAPVLVATDKGGRLYEISVALDLPLMLTVTPKHLQIADEQGLPVAASSAMNFQHVSTATTQKSFTFTVVNRTD
jgi:Carboxypeptidase regulatory-like domain